jgi:hypothetical protein
MAQPVKLAIQIVLRIFIRSESMLEKNSCDLLGDEISLLASHFLCQGRIIRCARTYADNEGLIAYPAHNSLDVFVSFAQTANHRLIADGPKRSALGRTLLQVLGKLRRNVGHDVYGDAQLQIRFPR